MKRRSAPSPAQRAALPIRTRLVIGPRGERGLALGVFCPRRNATTSIEICERCEHLDAIDVRNDPPAVACDAGPLPEPGEEPVGALARGSVLCVHRDAPLDVIDSDEREARVIPVVDDEHRYAGAIVRGRSSSMPPAPPDPLAELLDDHPTAEDAMEHVPVVRERDGVLAAAATMTSTRARTIPVVNDEGEVVGVVDDVALLASVARAHARSDTLKRCACGRLYTRSEWTVLPRVGSMRTADGRAIELRNCASCGSTIAVPASSGL